MASFISTNEVHESRINGVISRTGARIGNYVLEESTGVDVGLFVCANGTAGEACEDCDSAADVQNAIGLTIYQPGRTAASVVDPVNESNFYAQNDVIPVLEEGCMWVTSEGTVVAGQPVYARHTSDGGSNTTLGKVRADSDLPSGGLTITPSGATNDKYYSITLSDGSVNEVFTYLSDGTATVAEICTGLTALIDASAAFSATDNTTNFQVDSGSGIVEVVSADTELPVTTPGRCERVPGAYFKESRTGAGLVEIEVGRTNGKA